MKDNKDENGHLKFHIVMVIFTKMRVVFERKTRMKSMNAHEFTLFRRLTFQPILKMNPKNGSYIDLQLNLFRYLSLRTRVRFFSGEFVQVSLRSTAFMVSEQGMEPVVVL